MLGLLASAALLSIVSSQNLTRQELATPAPYFVPAQADFLPDTPAGQPPQPGFVPASALITQIELEQYSRARIENRSRAISEDYQQETARIRAELALQKSLTELRMRQYEQDRLAELQRLDTLREINSRLRSTAPATQVYADSLGNPYGAGSPYKPDGFMNPYSQNGSPYSNQSWRNPYATAPPILYDGNGNYRGRFSSNPYLPDSTSNPYGRYGSPYSPDSINNPYGAGSPYSTTPIYIAPSR